MMNTEIDNIYHAQFWRKIFKCKIYYRFCMNNVNILSQIVGNLPEEFNDDEEDSESEDEEESSLKGDNFDYHEGSSSKVDDSEDDVNLEEFQSSFKAATQSESKPEFR